MGDWKGIRYNVDKDHQSPLELYDLTTDIGEDNNVAADHPEVVQQINTIMVTGRTESPWFKFRHEKQSEQQ